MESISTRSKATALEKAIAIMAVVCLASAFLPPFNDGISLWGVLLIAAVISMISATEICFSKSKFPTTAICTAICFIFTQPQLLSFSTCKLSAVVLCAALFFTILALESERTEYAAIASFAIAGASCLLPPALWLLIPLFLILTLNSPFPARNLAGGALGLGMAVIAFCSITYIAGGGAVLLEKASSLADGIFRFEPLGISFRGWKSVRDLSAGMILVLSSFTYIKRRNHLTLRQEQKMDNTLVFLISLFLLMIPYGRDVHSTVAITALSSSAFFIIGNIHLRRDDRWLKALMWGYLILSLTEIVSRYVADLDAIWRLAG